MQLQPNGASTYFLCRLSNLSSRGISPEIAQVSDQFFNQELPPNEPGLLSAVDTIAATLAEGGSEEISAEELLDAVDKYYQVEGTPFCPPVMGALKTVI